MKDFKFLALILMIVFALSLSLAIGCGDDDDDDDDDDVDDDDDDDDDDDAEAMMEQAYEGCVGYWSDCGYDWTETERAASAEEFCQSWVDAYEGTMEEFADSMDFDCMEEVMGGFFTCMGESCDPEDTWDNCNAAVQADMIDCFES